MTHSVLLTLIVPVSLEEVLVDWLFENAPGRGFCSGPVNGHSGNHEALTLGEQVAGRKRQIRFEIHAPEDDARGMLERLGADLPGAAIHYWIAPLKAAGEI
jgi:hypothetical protein